MPPTPTRSSVEGGHPALVSGARQDKAVPIGSQGRWPYTLLESTLCYPKVPHPPGTDLGEELPAPCAWGRVGDHGVGVQLLPQPRMVVPPRSHLSLIQAPKWPPFPLSSTCLWQAQFYLMGFRRNLRKVPSHRTYQVATCDVASVWPAVTYKTSSEPHGCQEGSAPPP